MSDSVTKSENVTASGGHRDAITASASPRPWRMMTTGTLDPVTQVVDANGRPISDRRHIRANLALIVAAVNERDRLRDIVRRMEDNLARYHLIGERDRALLREARAAIGEEV